VGDFLQENGIEARIEQIDREGAYWKVEGSPTPGSTSGRKRSELVDGGASLHRGRAPGASP
jgi:hypothetical protein